MKRVLSYGGGLDSFAMLLDQLANGEKPDLVIFADVGDPQRQDPGEWPGTYDHIARVVTPICFDEGIELKWLDTTESPIRGERSLFRYFERKRIMPSRMSRLCTAAAKVERIRGYVQERFPDEPVEMWIGFEAGEENRAARDPHGKASGARIYNRFPLIERKLCRCRCELLVIASGHPVPRKSACVFCPFATRGDFQRLMVDLPEQFERIEQLEENCRPTKKGKIMRYGYRKGDGSDPALRAWVQRPYTRALLRCDVCGTSPRATKAAGCDWLYDGVDSAGETVAQ